MNHRLRCMTCNASYPPGELRYVCDCGGLLDVEHDLAALRGRVSRELFDSRRGDWTLPYASGVWRYRELILPVDEAVIVSRPEGNTPLYRSQRLSRWTGIDDLALKHEGENPTGSFKDRGMTVGVTQARLLGVRAVACASTGNTSASMAAYAALAGLQALVFIPEGKIAYGKLAQALAYGAQTLQVRGDFDAAMRLVRQVCDDLGIYLLNSLNPFRIEGQKAIIFELLQQREWEVPDWIVFPAGNLGNTAAFGKALYELKEVGLISHLPRLAAVQASLLPQLRRRLPAARTSDRPHGGHGHPHWQPGQLRAGRPLPALDRGPGNRGERRGDHGCKSASGRGGHRLRAGIGGGGGRGAAAGGGRGHPPRPIGGGHPHRPSAEGPGGDRGLSPGAAGGDRIGLRQPASGY